MDSSKTRVHRVNVEVRLDQSEIYLNIYGGVGLPKILACCGPMYK